MRLSDTERVQIASVVDSADSYTRYDGVITRPDIYTKADGVAITLDRAQQLELIDTLELFDKLTRVTVGPEKARRGAFHMVTLTHTQREGTGHRGTLALDLRAADGVHPVVGGLQHELRGVDARSQAALVTIGVDPGYLLDALTLPSGQPNGAKRLQFKRGAGDNAGLDPIRIDDGTDHGALAIVMPKRI